MKAFSPELESTPIHAQDATSDCHSEPDKAAHSDHGIVTLAAIEMVLEEAMHPVLERLFAIERKLSDLLPSSGQRQDFPVSVTPFSTPPFVYDDDEPQLSPNGTYTLAGSLFGTSDFASSEDDGNEFDSSSHALSVSSGDDKKKERGRRDQDIFYR